MSICGGFVAAGILSPLPVPAPLLDEVAEVQGARHCSQILRKAQESQGGTQDAYPPALALPCPTSSCPVEGTGTLAYPSADGGWPGSPAEWAFAAILAEMHACPAPEAGLAVGCPSLQSTIWHQVHCLFLINVSADCVNTFP